MIDKLTDDQIKHFHKLVDVYVDKLTQTPGTTKHYVKAFYEFKGWKPAPVFVAPSPFAHVALAATLEYLFDNGVDIALIGQTPSFLQVPVTNTALVGARDALANQLSMNEDAQATAKRFLIGVQNGEFKDNLRRAIDVVYAMNWWGLWANFYQFALDIGIPLDRAKFELFNGLVTSGQAISAYKEVAVVSENPVKIHKYAVEHSSKLLGKFTRHVPHANGKVAYEFKDGLGIHYFHGVYLPSKYGKHHTMDWKPEWIFKEQNVDIRRILLQEIGYDRLYSYGDKLDTYTNKNDGQHYTLYRLPANLMQGDEDLVIVTMDCPSTGYHHAVPVHPTTKTAYDAYLEAWGVAPEVWAVER